MISRTKLTTLGVTAVVALSFLAPSAATVSASSNSPTTPSTTTQPAPKSIVAQGTTIDLIDSNGVSVPVEMKQEIAKRVNLMTRIAEDLAMDQTGRLSLKTTPAQLAKKYGLTVSDLLIVQQVITANSNAVAKAEDPIETRAYVKNWNLYLSYGEIVGIMSAVNDVGPLVLVSAISAAASVVPGAGTIIGGVIGLFGAGAIILQLTKAIAQHKGIRMGLDGIAAVNY